MKHKPFFHFIFVLILFIALVGVYVAWHGIVVGARTSVYETASAIEAKTREAKQIADIQERIASFFNDESALETHFVSSDTVVSYLQELEELGSTLGTTLEVVSVTNDPGQGRLSISLQIEGSFDAVMRTVGVIEYGQYDAMITTLNIEKMVDSALWSATGTLSVGTGEKGNTE